jgi:hypothetical protein
MVKKLLEASCVKNGQNASADNRWQSGEIRNAAKMKLNTRIYLSDGNGFNFVEMN